MYKPTRTNRAIALIMAVAIMAVLAVVGFGFVSSMKLESAATSAIRNRTQAQLAAYAALQLLSGALVQDALRVPGENAGPIADHLTETLYTTPVDEDLEGLVEWGNLTAKATVLNQAYYPPPATVPLRDESSKMNLNAFGNISKVDFTPWTSLNDNSDLSSSGADVTETAQLYHGANERLSSFEVSFEEFFYQCYLDRQLWSPAWAEESLRLKHPDDAESGDDAKKARVRCARLAMAICLYRYGGKKGGLLAGPPAYYGGDGMPGTAGSDDDGDDDPSTNGEDDDEDGLTDNPEEAALGLAHDGIDNDGDALNDDGTIDPAKVDEQYEGKDEPDEFNPYKPAGDDAKFDDIEEFKDAIAHPYKCEGTDAFGVNYTPDVPAAVDYTDSLTATEITDEAQRVYDAVKDQLTVHSYSLDIRSVSIDDPGRDGYDNDGDGDIDGADGSGASTIAELVAAFATTKPHAIGINESSMTKAAQAAYLYLRLTEEFDYVEADGNSVTQELVPGFTLKNALDIVDYRDMDFMPTKITRLQATALDCNVFAETGYPADKELYGMEGLHVTEVGRYIPNVGDPRLTTGTPTRWAWDDTAHKAEADIQAGDDRVCTLTFDASATLLAGKYQVKMTVDVPAGGTLEITTDPGGSDQQSREIEAGAGQTVLIGPLAVDATNGGDLRLDASVGTGIFRVSSIEILLPYVEIMNMGKKTRSLSQVRLEIEDAVDVTKKQLVSIGTGTYHSPGAPAHGDALLDWQIPGHKKVVAGFEGGAGTHGPWYGYLVYVYDAESFERNFPGRAPAADGDGTWGNQPGEDFPIVEVNSPGNLASDVFYHGFDGTQKVRLKTTAGDLVAGGPIDFYTDAGAGMTFSAIVLAAGRTQVAGDLSYAKGMGATAFSKEVDASPGRWNSPEHGLAADYTERFWPQTVATFTNEDYKYKRDIVTISDAGYFRSPGELSELSLHNMYSVTLSLAEGWDTTPSQPDYQMAYNNLFAYCVASRAPARVNLNTAPTAVLAAAIAGAPLNEPGVDALVAARPFENTRAMTDDAADETPIIDAYKGNGADDDGSNDGDDYNEAYWWVVKYYNVFTLRGHVFKAIVSGQVVNDAATPQVFATWSLEAMYDRGKKLDSDGKPSAQLLYTTQTEASE